MSNHNGTIGMVKFPSSVLWLGCAWSIIIAQKKRSGTFCHFAMLLHHVTEKEMNHG